MIHKRDLEILKQLNQERRVIGVLVKWYRAFYTSTENFNKPADAALVGVFCDRLKGAIDEETLAKFDVVIWYTVSDNDDGEDVGKLSLKSSNQELTKKLLTETKSFALQGVEDALRSIAEVVDCMKLRLIVWEEILVYSVMNIGEALGIPGPTNADLEKIRNKKPMKEFAFANGIPTAPFIVLSDFSAIRTVQETIEKALSYPMFVKPVFGSGSAGSARLNNSDELAKWLMTVDTDAQIEFLFETCIEGATEFWAEFLITRNNGAELASVDYMPLMGMFDSLNFGKIAWCSATPEEANLQMPGVVDFSYLVAEKFAPPPPGHFTVQGFHLKDGGFLLTELAYRLSGVPLNIGLGHEIPHLMAVLDDNYKLERDDEALNSQNASVWFAMVPGTLQSKSLSQLKEVKSDVKVTWFIEPGTKMEKAATLADMVVVIYLYNKNKDECWADMNLLFNKHMIDVAA